MRSVKSKNTKPELLVRKVLTQLGYRYRLHRKDIAGSPDIVFAGRKKVIFINGCFWHGHNCKRGKNMPESNKEKWMAKIERNKSRDLDNYKKLRKGGWKHFIVWECEIKKKRLNHLENKLVTYLDT